MDKPLKGNCQHSKPPAAAPFSRIRTLVGAIVKVQLVLRGLAAVVLMLAVIQKASV
jgi:hypothetical protein